MNTIIKPEFPRPEKQRNHWLNLNGSWDFQLFAEGEEQAEKVFAQNREAYDSVIQVPFSWTCPLSGVEKDVAGIGWYRRYARFNPSGRIFLCFGAVDYLAEAFVNGQSVGRHQGGYTYFEMEVTDCWHDGDNLIEVRAEDYRRETQTYGKQGYGEIQGIWQTVWLECRPKAYIDHFRITTKMDGLVTFCVDTADAQGALVTVNFNQQCAQAVVDKNGAELSLQVDSPRLWSPDDPYLYEGTVTLKNGDEEDVIQTYFGIREFGVTKPQGKTYSWITLNGNPLYLNGTLDQAFHPTGYFTYPNEEEIKLEAWRLKRLELNLVRIHIKPEEPRKLYWMDKLGILVMEDIPCFWGVPNEEAKAAYEQEWPDIMKRDINHPSTIAWIMFNETWGLFDKKRVYTPETQEWVRSVYRRAKAYDATRFVEDNSACNYDHVESDLNTWHFYINGYEQVRDHIRKVVNESEPGSTFNYIGGNCQNGVPLMNSECGMVWGVDKSAGDSDLAWQYHYMLNEYRLHEKLCGFVFTEFHDVVNEFNGYYRIDGEDKDFGYQDFCDGMCLKDLHAADFVALDCAPVRDAKPCEEISVPMVLSSFSAAHHGKQCTLAWELWHDGINGRVKDDGGVMALPAFGFGTTALTPLTVTMPKENALAILSLYLKDENSNVISRNFTTFSVHAPLPKNLLEVPVSMGKTEGFSHVWQAMGGEKLCLGGEGTVTYPIKLPYDAKADDITVYLEGSSKRVLAKDRSIVGKKEADFGFMRGYRVDRGAFENSYWMTDETRLPGMVEVIVNGVLVEVLQFGNDWADARGVLSWHRQPNVRLLDEAGSYGEQKCIRIPSRLIPEILREGVLTLSFRVVSPNGFALYGRECGRYAHGLLVEMK